MSYVIGSIWLFCLLLLFFIVGSTFSNIDRCGPSKILVGYLIYSFGIALFGIYIQIFNLEYKLFKCIMCIWIATLFVVSIIFLFKRKRSDNWRLKIFIKNYWALILIVCGVLFLSILNYPAFWLGNHLDDGFYLSKIASYPYVEKPFEHDLSTGLYTGHIINSYSFNTHELEAAVFLETLRIPIGIFTRVFLAAEGLIIFACCIYSLGIVIFRQSTVLKKYQSIIQFIPGILFLFSANYNFLANHGIMDIQDSWQTTTAMYFGSSIVKTSGFFLIFLPFLKDFKLNWKVTAQVIGISIVLVSKSTVAIPLIFVASISYLLIWGLFEPGKIKFLFFVLFICLGVLGLIIPELIQLENYGFDSYQFIALNIDTWLDKLIHSYIPWLCLPGLITGVVSKKIKLILLETVIFILLFIPGFRSYASILSFFAFVTGRVISAYVYFLTCTMISFIVYSLSQLRIRPSLLAITGTICSMFLAGINSKAFLSYGGSALIVPQGEIAPITYNRAFEVLRKNPNFIPIDVENLSKALNRLVLDKNKVTLLTETDYESDDVSNSLYVMTKSLAPNVIFPAANIRFNTTVDPIYGSYGAEQQAVFNEFLKTNDDLSTVAFKQILDSYQINAVLLRDSKTYDDAMHSLGFSLYETIYGDEGRPEYYLYVR